MNDEPGLSLAELLNQHGERIQRFCGRLTGGHPDTLDLAQDVFVIAIEQQAKFRGESSLETWLLGIAVRVCRRWVRRQSLRYRVFGNLFDLRPLMIADSAARVDLNDQLRTGLERLKPKHREILVLHYLEEMEIDEIKRLLKLSRSAVDQRLCRARAELGGWLERQ